MTGRRSARLRLLPAVVVGLLVAVAGVAPPAEAFRTRPFKGLFDGQVCSLEQCLLSAGDDDLLRPWSVGLGSIDLTPNTFWQSQSGPNSIDLSGTRAGTISQVFGTVPGTTYQVTYWVSGNPSCGNPVKHLLVRWNSSWIATATFDTTGHTFADMGWTRHRAVATARAEVSSLGFRDTSFDGSACGVALDSVRVHALP